jgi:DNA-binding LacI/PurR family transcriptional regulator
MQAMRALLAERPRPTAVFCANDLAAVGALKACAAAGVRVPAELSVVGCDDVELARLVTPELTTVRVPARELGARAARLLVQRLAGDAPNAPDAPAAPAAPDPAAGPAAPAGRPPRAAAPRLLPVRLVARGSTAQAEAA